MALGEETLLDAPVTPAPVFAYRALRAVIWGEDKTPERPPQNAHLTLDTRTKYAANNLDMKPPLEFTPGQKRKHTMLSQLSPTKSILRTPGAHTPRRAMLKDLNVKFKDLRKSVSPELVHKVPLHAQGDIVAQEKENIFVKGATGKDVATNQALTVPSEPLKPSLSTTTSTKTMGSTTLNQAPIQHVAPVISTTVDTTTGFDAEAYMRSTEKEMKKLIKYGQKMREYAKRQDEENNQLRQMLEEIRKENERLQRQLETLKSADRTVEKSRVPSKSVKVGDRSTEQPARRMSSTSISKQEPPKSTKEMDFLDLPDPDKKTTQRQSSTRTKRRHQEHPANPEPLKISLLRQSPSPSPPKKARHNSPPTHEQNLPLRSITTTNGTSHSKLAPDRLAAARARVRKKAELRKTSAELDEGGTVNGDVNADVDGKVDASVLDWAGL